VELIYVESDSIFLLRKCNTRRKELIENHENFELAVSDDFSISGALANSVFFSGGM
jgi:hypothetical protein